MTVTLDGKPVDVTAYEFSILRALAQRPGQRAVARAAARSREGLGRAQLRSLDRRPRLAAARQARRRQPQPEDPEDRARRRLPARRRRCLTRRDAASHRGGAWSIASTAFAAVARDRDHGGAARPAALRAQRRATSSRRPRSSSTWSSAGRRKDPQELDERDGADRAAPARQADAVRRRRQRSLRIDRRAAARSRRPSAETRDARRATSGRSTGAASSCAATTAR